MKKIRIIQFYEFLIVSVFFFIAIGALTYFTSDNIILRTNDSFVFQTSEKSKVFAKYLTFKEGERRSSYQSENNIDIVPPMITFSHENVNVNVNVNRVGFNQAQDVSRYAAYTSYTTPDNDGHVSATGCSNSFALLPVSRNSRSVGDGVGFFSMNQANNSDFASSSTPFKSATSENLIMINPGADPELNNMIPVGDGRWVLAVLMFIYILRIKRKIN